MNFLKKKNGFTLVEAILALALLSLVAILFVSMFGTAIKLYKLSLETTKNTYVATGQIEDWYSQGQKSLSAITGNFVLTYNSVKKVDFTGKYIATNAIGNNILAYEPKSAIIYPLNEVIVCKNLLKVNEIISCNYWATINAKNITLATGKYFDTKLGSTLYTDTTPRPSGFDEYDSYKITFSPLPVSANATYVAYSGGDKSFDTTNGDAYFYVNNFSLNQSSKFTVTNNSTSKTHKNVYIFISEIFHIGPGIKLTVAIGGTGKDYTGVYFVYSGSEMVTLDGDRDANDVLISKSLGITCNAPGTFIYAPSANIGLIGDGLSGVMGANIEFNGNSNSTLKTFLPSHSFAGRPNWQDITLKLAGT